MIRTGRLRALIMIAVAALIAPVLVALAPTAEPAAAATGGAFNAGNIISDSLFYDGGAMNSDQVEGLLQGKVPRCSSGYICLKDYTQATPNLAGDAYCPDGYAGSGSERAADIIAKVGAACNISQRVLLVLLEKEQSLVSLTNPGSGRYLSATGFNCPDTAPCDPNVAGFFYQIYYAARQFQNYAQNPTHWNYQAGRVNSILYSPVKSTCPNPPRGDVFIQNKATAGLYIYTPYQPNAPALANLYGSGDGCSSYGNRNFWRLFTDWFGPTTAASTLLRTVDNATLYLVAGDSKYPIASVSVWIALAPLGPVGYVSQQYLDGLSTGHTVGRTIRDPGGTIYFIDSGIKLPLTSCSQATDYGASCDPSGYVQLSDIQSAAFSTGPTLSNVLGTVEGARYYIHAGTKAEILDDQSQVAAGIPLGMNVLSENAVASLPLVAPIVRDGTFVVSRGVGSTSLLAGDKSYPVAAADVSAVGASTRVSGSLWPASLAMIPASTTGFTGVSTLPAGGTALLNSDGRYTLAGDGLSSTAVPVQVPQTLVDSYADKGTIAPGAFIKSPGGGTIYVVMATNILPIASWDALLALTPPGQAVGFITLSQTIIDKMAQGPVALQSGTLVRSPQNATVYFMNGVTDRIAFSSFIFPVEAGFGNLVFADDSRLQAYPIDPKLMGFGLTCGATVYVAADGQVHLVDPTLQALYPFTNVALDPFVCAQLKIGAPATSFIRTADGSIYQLVGGQKLPITTMARFSALSNGQAWLNVANEFAAAIPTGPLA